MIGNDIVDLAKAYKESNWQRKGFLDKLFAPSEQKLILSSENPELALWKMWTCKESAYKIYNRQTGERFFRPAHFVCQADQVVFGDFKCHVKTQVTPEFIYTVALASADTFDLVTHFEDRTNVKKENGIPQWFDVAESQWRPASITHHGRFTKMVRLGN